MLSLLALALSSRIKSVSGDGSNVHFDSVLSRLLKNVISPSIHSFLFFLFLWHTIIPFHVSSIASDADEIFDTATKRLRSCECVEVDGEASQIKFRVASEDKDMIVADAVSLPLIYEGGTRNRADPVGITFECLSKSGNGTFAYQSIPATECADEIFQIDSGNTHVIECIGKPHGSKVHMRVTTTEPYGVCCIGGLKISMIMHNFGEKRWGRGIVDDIRSHTDQNTRVVGDFTKNVSTAKISEKMLDYLTVDKDRSDWTFYFNEIFDSSVGEASPSKVSMTVKLIEMLKEHKIIASGARRPYLQTRFFETGDNVSFVSCSFHLCFGTFKTTFST